MVTSQSEFCVISMNFSGTLWIRYKSRSLKTASCNGLKGLRAVILLMNL